MEYTNVVVFRRTEASDPEYYNLYYSQLAAQHDADWLKDNGYWYDEDGNGPYPIFETWVAAWPIE